MSVDDLLEWYRSEMWGLAARAYVANLHALPVRLWFRNV